MSTAKRFVFAALIAGALVALNAAAALAQAGPSNPSGGTSLRQTTLEGSGSFGPAAIFASNRWSPAGWQGWFAPRYAAWLAGWTSDRRSLSAIVRRPVALR